MVNVEVIKLSSSDLIHLQKIGRQTFYETFSATNTEENMQRYLEEDFSVEKLADQLNSEFSSFYFVKYEDEIIGYLKLNFGESQTELKQEKALEIERIYVLKQFHGKRIGQILYDKAIEIAIHKNVEFVWLGVWEENPRAISFYKKNGFVEFDKHIFKLGEDEQTDIMMRLDMKEIRREK